MAKPNIKKENDQIGNCFTSPTQQQNSRAVFTPVQDKKIIDCLLKDHYLKVKKTCCKCATEWNEETEN
jgi:hypothetical protein